MQDLEWLKSRMQQRWRRRRMQAFVSRLQPEKGCRIVDLGGTADIWKTVPGEFEITLVNLMSQNADIKAGSRHRFHYVQADVTEALPFKDACFEIAFSNSVIEHVGGIEKQRRFAATVRRLADNYWIQTPSIHFPIEAHSNQLYWWYWPESFQSRMLQHWQNKNRHFLVQQMKTTGVVTEQRLNTLFPDSSVFIERCCGFSKSITAYRKS